MASNFINAVQAHGNNVWVCMREELAELDCKTNTWVAYRSENWIVVNSAKAEKATCEGILTAQLDRKKCTVETPTRPYKCILNLAF